MKRYQKEYASGRPQMYDVSSREIKAYRMVKTLANHFGEKKLKTLTVLDIGASTGIIDNILSEHFKKVVGVDIDKGGIAFAKKKFKRKNLTFQVEDAMKLSFKAKSFDIVICTHVYEHVPNSTVLFQEIYRVLKPRGVCYLAAVNALWPIEPHYNLPFLSYLPKFIANKYLELFKSKKEYYETLLTYWGLMKITKSFNQIHYTDKIILDPAKYGYEDSFIRHLPFFARRMIASISQYIFPTTFWLLEKK